MFRADVADARQACLKAAKQDPEQDTSAGSKRFPRGEEPRGAVARLPPSPAHLRGMAGNGRGPPESGAIGDAALDDHPDHGYLFPGQDAATVARFPSMLGNEPAARRARGTDGVVAHEDLQRADGSAGPSGQESAAHPQRSGRDLVRAMRRSPKTGRRG
jgi:hypothetical protein